MSDRLRRAIAEIAAWLGLRQPVPVVAERAPCQRPNSVQVTSVLIAMRRRPWRPPPSGR